MRVAFFVSLELEGDVVLGPSTSPGPATWEFLCPVPNLTQRGENLGFVSSICGSVFSFLPNLSSWCSPHTGHSPLRRRCSLPLWREHRMPVTVACPVRRLGENWR